MNVCSQLPTFVAAVPDKMPYMKPEDLDMCINKVMQLESLVMYHDSVIKKRESTFSAAEHSPMQKNQPEQGVDSWADVASFGEDEPLPAFGAGPCVSTANNDGFIFPRM